MNPVALQLAGAKRTPLAPTSWGAFGPHWLWVSPQSAGVVVDTEAGVVETRAGVTSIVTQDGIGFYSCDVFFPTAECETL